MLFQYRSGFPIAAVSMLCLTFSFLPFKSHKDVIIEGIKTQVKCKNKYQWVDLTKWCLECLFLYLGSIGVFKMYHRLLLVCSLNHY